MLRKRLERLEAQAAQPDGEDPPPGGGGGGGDGGGAGGKAAKDRERVRPDPPTPPDSDADSSEDDVGGGGHRGPPRLGGGVGRDDAVGELFGGHVLACDYDSDNPFERKRGLQQRTSHYSPAAAGDTVHAELHRKLGAANQREVCTLLPSLSYMYDLCAHLERLEDAIGDERDDPGDSRRALRLVHEQVRAARLQAGSILAFGQERLDELESVGKGALEAAEFDPLYGNERSQSGARSLLGQRLHESRVSRRHTRLGSAVASADIARLKPKPPGASKRLSAAWAAAAAVTVAEVGATVAAAAGGAAATAAATAADNKCWTMLAFFAMMVHHSYVSEVFFSFLLVGRTRTLISSSPRSPDISRESCTGSPLAHPSLTKPFSASHGQPSVRTDRASRQCL